MAEPVLVVDAVAKSFGDVHALNRVSLAARAGERVALLGHNGAGKSTLMKLALGLTRLDVGRIVIDGESPGSVGARAKTAFLPEAVAFHPALTGREQLKLFAALAGEPARVIDGLLERVGLAAAADRRIRGWSKGMRQRLGLAQALLGRPKLALLDEPTSGLDPISRHELYAIIDEIASRGAAVVIASHALTEMEARTDRIAILSKGRMVADDTLSGLRAQAGMPIRIKLTVREDAIAAVSDALGGRRVNGASLELRCAPSEKMARLSQIARLGEAVSDIELTPPGLEDLYRHYSEGRLA